MAGNNFLIKKKIVLGIFISTQEKQTVNSIMEYTGIKKEFASAILNTLKREGKISGKNVFKICYLG